MVVITTHIKEEVTLNRSQGIRKSDWEIYTEGKSILDAIGLKGIDYEDDGKEIPEASSYEAALEKF